MTRETKPTRLSQACAGRRLPQACSTGVTPPGTGWRGVPRWPPGAARRRSPGSPRRPCGPADGASGRSSRRRSAPCQPGRRDRRLPRSGGCPAAYPAAMSSAPSATADTDAQRTRASHRLAGGDGGAEEGHHAGDGGAGPTSQGKVQRQPGAHPQRSRQEGGHDGRDEEGECQRDGHHGHQAVCAPVHGRATDAAAVQLGHRSAQCRRSPYSPE